MSKSVFWSCFVIICFAGMFLNGSLRNVVIGIAAIILLSYALLKISDFEKNFEKLSRYIERRITERLEDRFEQERKNVHKEIVCKRITIKDQSESYATLIPEAILFCSDAGTVIGMGQKGIYGDSINCDSLTIKDRKEDILVQISTQGILVNDYMNGPHIIRTHVYEKHHDENWRPITEPYFGPRFKSKSDDDKSNT